MSTIFAFTHSSLIGIKENLIDLIKLNEIPRGGIYPCIFINGIITIILLSIHLYSLLKKKKNQVKLLMILVSLDVFIMFQLSIPTTFINKYRLHGHVEGFRKLTNNINQEPTIIPLKNLNEGDIHIDALWRNKSTFSKTPHYQGVNPTRSKSFLEMTDNNGLNFIIENPIFFIPYNEISSTINQIPKPNSGWSLPDGIHAQKETKINKAEIGYNSFWVELENQTSSKSLVALSQNYHHYWKAFINGKQTRVYKINDGIMGVEIPANYSGKILFDFSPSIILKISVFISVISYLVVLYITFKFLRKESKKVESS
ncbi:MAG: YfhO family protein [Chloroflexia bacterium]|nr:YfhO family protein [Chloroflexia bacterium]